MRGHLPRRGAAPPRRRAAAVHDPVDEQPDGPHRGAHRRAERRRDQAAAAQLPRALLLPSLLRRLLQTGGRGRIQDEFRQLGKGATLSGRDG